MFESCSLRSSNTSRTQIICPKAKQHACESARQRSTWSKSRPFTPHAHMNFRSPVLLHARYNPLQNHGGNPLRRLPAHTSIVIKTSNMTRKHTCTTKRCRPAPRSSELVGLRLYRSLCHAKRVCMCAVLINQQLSRTNTSNLLVLTANRHPTALINEEAT